MTTETLSKPANELSASELKALLAQKEQAENEDKAKKRLDYENLREATVSELVKKAIGLNALLTEFKKEAWSELETIYKLLQEHSSRHADGKGSFSMETSDAKMRISYKRQDNTKFDERATQAEQHILDFLTERFGDDAPTSKLIRKFLERKKGQLDKNEVLKVISMKDEFANENWRKGIQLLEESIVPGETKYYARFELKDEEGVWQTIPLDFARL